MQRYVVAKKLGDGTYGEVLRAVNKQTGEVVAVKRMKKKYYSWDDCMALREVQSLRKLRHPNIVKLKEVIREHDILHMIFEHMECNLYEYMKDRKKFFPETQLRNILYQMIQGLAFMHNNGYFHRDMKPENVLINKDVTKIADFGLAREIRSRPPYTEYVSTRWYRAPEILLRAKDYNAPVDNFAVGCIIAELLMLRPLFPGSTESDMIQKMCQILGTPSDETWPDGLRLAQLRRIKLPSYNKVPLQKLMPHASRDAIALTDALLLWDPTRRMTAAQALQHPFFQLHNKDGAAPQPAAGPQAGLQEQASRKSVHGLSPRKPKVSGVAGDNWNVKGYAGQGGDGSKPSGPHAQALDPSGAGPPLNLKAAPESGHTLPLISETARRQYMKERLAHYHPEPAAGQVADSMTLRLDSEAGGGPGNLKAAGGSEYGGMSARTQQSGFPPAQRHGGGGGGGAQAGARDGWQGESMRKSKEARLQYRDTGRLGAVRETDGAGRARPLQMPDRKPGYNGGGVSKVLPGLPGPSSTLSGAEGQRMAVPQQTRGRVGGLERVEGRDGIWHRHAGGGGALGAGLRGTRGAGSEWGYGGKAGELSFAAGAQPAAVSRALGLDRADRRGGYGMEIGTEYRRRH